MNKSTFVKLPVVLLAILFMHSSLFSQENHATEEIIRTNQSAKGTLLEIEFQKGLEHYHPLMAIWVEDMEGNYVHSLYISRSLAKGIFGHAYYKDGVWQEGEKKVPSALPYWLHQRDLPGPDSLYIPTPDHPIADAFTGATPTGNFILKTVVADTIGPAFRVLFEVNQSWDWNEYWYNSKYPDNQEYLKSAQPALVYEAVVDLQVKEKPFVMKPIGHSHPYGATGELFEDLSTLTTALEIAEKIEVRIISSSW